jgi:hypothetical protein
MASISFRRTSDSTAASRARVVKLWEVFREALDSRETQH